MERREFLEKIGIGAAFVLTTSCFQSCKKEDTTIVTPTTGVDFTVDITTETKLQTKGNFIIKNDVVIALGNDNKYYAATINCSHEAFKKVIYNKDSNEYFCTEHGARFDLTGRGLNKEGEKNLTIYKTTLTGNSLRIQS